MKLVDIFQTLEYRGNEDEVKKHGPYLCTLTDAHGNRKTGIKEPWLGEGYYFWDYNIEDARWWGETCYKRYCKGYIIWKTKYDQHSHLLFDMVGNLDHFDEFIKCAEYIKKQLHKTKVSFSYVLSVLKDSGGFTYKAIRVWPYPLKNSFNTGYYIKFPGNTATIIKLRKVQICFFDSTLLTMPFEIAERNTNTVV